MLCTICRRNVALGKVAGPIRGQWCYKCLWDHANGRMNMAAERECKHENCEVAACNLHLYCCDCGKDLDAGEEE